MRKRFVSIFVVIIFAFLLYVIANNAKDQNDDKLIAGWGDNSLDQENKRPSYTKAEIDAGALGDTITFNSISDNSALGEGKDGNEKNFVAAREYNDTDTSHKWQADDITVEDGKEYVIRMYVHNNSPKGTKAIAKETRVFFNIPNDSGTQLRITGFLNSSNAIPSEYWDSVVLNSSNGKSFHLEPVGGSAAIDNKGVGKNDGAALDNDIWGGTTGNTDGVLIGYDSLNGEIPGCFEYDSIVTARVKVIYDYSYTVNTKVRLADVSDKTWKKSVDAKIGDKVEFQIEYKNTSDFKHDNVIIDDQLPSNLHYVPGSTWLINGNNPSGLMVNEDDVVKTGLLIGNYAPGANAIIRFYAKVVDDNFTCGKWILHNWGRASVGMNLMQDSAAVIVQLPYCLDLEDVNATIE